MPVDQIFLAFMDGFPVEWQDPAVVVTVGIFEGDPAKKKRPAMIIRIIFFIPFEFLSEFRRASKKARLENCLFPPGDLLLLQR